MRRFLVPCLLAIGVTCSPAAQAQSEVAVGYPEGYQHVIEPQHTWVRVPKPPLGMPQLRLTLTVSPQGDVVHAEAQGNAEEMDAWPTAQAMVYRWKYRPFLRDGHAVTAVVKAGLTLVPPEIPPKADTEPGLRPDSRVQISLERTGCYGSCAAYTVTLSAQGVTYEGARFNAVEGTHYAPLEEGALHALAQRMLDAGWFGMNDRYTAAWTDNPTQTVTLTVDGQTRKVIDYVGIEAGMPDAVRDVEYEIDRVAGSGRWVHAASGLASLLHGEGFDFKSPAAQALLRAAAASGDVASVRQLLAAGVPRERLARLAEKVKSDRPESSGFDGLLTAAAQEPNVLRVMIDAGVGAGDPVDKNVALASAVSAGNAEAARLLLHYGADARADLAALRAQTPPSAYWAQHPDSLLLNAARSGDPETVQLVLSQLPPKDITAAGNRAVLVELAASGTRDQAEQRARCAHLLLNAGADIRGTDDRGRTALHVAQGVPLVAELVNAGAEVNAQDHDGNTPAFSTSDPAVFQYLATHGAILPLRNRAGQTALQNPHRYAPEWAPAYAAATAAQVAK